MQFGRNTDARTAWTSIVGFACNQGFVFSLFYLGSNRGLGDGVHVFERAELFGTLLFMTAAFVLLRLVAPRARDALLGSPARLVLCGAARGGSFVPLLVENPAVAASCWKARFWGCRPAAFWPLGAVRSAATHRAVGSGGVLGIGARRGGVLRLRGRPGGGRRARPEAFAARQRGRSAPASGGSSRVCPRAGRRRRHAPFGQDRRRHRRVRPGGGLMETYGSDPGMATTPTFPVTLFLSSSSASPPCSCSAAEAGRPPRTSRLQRGKARSTGPTGWRCCL